MSDTPDVDIEVEVEVEVDPHELEIEVGGEQEAEAELELDGLEIEVEAEVEIEGDEAEEGADESAEQELAESGDDVPGAEVAVDVDQTVRADDDEAAVSHDVVSGDDVDDDEASGDDVDDDETDVEPVESESFAPEAAAFPPRESDDEDFGPSGDESPELETTLGKGEHAGETAGEDQEGSEPSDGESGRRVDGTDPLPSRQPDGE